MGYVEQIITLFVVPENKDTSKSILTNESNFHSDRYRGVKMMEEGDIEREKNSHLYRRSWFGKK